MDIFLRWAGVTVFTLLSWRYLWNGRDEFSGKEWRLTLLKMVGLLVGFALALLILLGLHQIWPVMDRRLAATSALLPYMSLLTILMNKILIAPCIRSSRGSCSFIKSTTRRRITANYPHPDTAPSPIGCGLSNGY